MRPAQFLQQLPVDFTADCKGLRAPVFRIDDSGKTFIMISGRRQSTERSLQVNQLRRPFLKTTSDIATLWSLQMLPNAPNMKR